MSAFRQFASAVAVAVAAIAPLALTAGPSWAAPAEAPMLLQAAPPAPAGMAADLHRIAVEWARIKYRVDDSDRQLREIESLARDAAAIAARYPNRAEPLIWQGIVTSEEAAMATVFHKLGLASDARRLFEHAEAIDPGALHGAVPLCLGVVYYRVPGFPVGFGDDDKARRYLEAALRMDPDGLDANYFYGDFLIEQGEYARAKTVLEHALAAPHDADRPVWDAGRRAEVKALIAKAGRYASR